jgi:hypothetical protein
MKAFPHIAKVHMLDGNSIIKEEITSGGMDLRDYFAASALNAMGHYYINAISNEVIASKCYAVADAMIRVRNENN